MSPSRAEQPTVRATHAVALKAALADKLALYVDLHAHATKVNPTAEHGGVCFAFCCRGRTSGSFAASRRE
jgi:hypothetical protein